MGDKSRIHGHIPEGFYHGIENVQTYRSTKGWNGLNINFISFEMPLDDKGQEHGYTIKWDGRVDHNDTYKFYIKRILKMEHGKRMELWTFDHQGRLLEHIDRSHRLWISYNGRRITFEKLTPRTDPFNNWGIRTSAILNEENFYEREDELASLVAVRFIPKEVEAIINETKNRAVCLAT
jgi:hypothetical protein